MTGPTGTIGVDRLAGNDIALSSLGATSVEHAEAVKQAAVADRLLISKTDLADIDASAGLRVRLEALNPGAALFEIVQGEIDPALLFDSGPFDPAGKSDRVRAWLGAEAHDHHHHH